MKPRAMRVAAIATIVVFLSALGLGELLAYYIVTPAHHLAPWGIAAACAIAIIAGFVIHARARRER